MPPRKTGKRKPKSEEAIPPRRSGRSRSTTPKVSPSRKRKAKASPQSQATSKRRRKTAESTPKPKPAAKSSLGSKELLQSTEFGIALECLREILQRPKADLARLTCGELTRTVAEKLSVTGAALHPISEAEVNELISLALEHGKFLETQHLSVLHVKNVWMEGETQREYKQKLLDRVSRPKSVSSRRKKSPKPAAHEVQHPAPSAQLMMPPPAPQARFLTQDGQQAGGHQWRQQQWQWFNQFSHQQQQHTQQYIQQQQQQQPFPAAAQSEPDKPQEELQWKDQQPVPQSSASTEVQPPESALDEANAYIRTLQYWLLVERQRNDWLEQRLREEEQRVLFLQQEMIKSLQQQLANQRSSSTATTPSSSEQAAAAAPSSSSNGELSR